MTLFYNNRLIVSLLWVLSLMSCGGAKPANDNSDSVDEFSHTSCDVEYDDSDYDYSSELNCSLNSYLSIYDSPWISGIDDIVGYFDNIIDGGNMLPCRYDVEEMTNRVMDIARVFQDIKEGRRDNYSATEIKSVLSSMLFDIAYFENHLMGYEPRHVLIIPRMLEMAAYYSSNIYDLATVVSEDGEWGAIEIPNGYNDNYIFTALVNRYYEEGVERYGVIYLPMCYSRVNKIRKLGEDLYLATYELNDRITSCYLLRYPYDSGNVIDLNNANVLDDWNLYHVESNNDAITLYYNPKKLAWQWCKKNKFGNLEYVKDSPVLYMDSKDFRYLYID